MWRFGGRRMLRVYSFVLFRIRLLHGRSEDVGIKSSSWMAIRWQGMEVVDHGVT